MTHQIVAAQQTPRTAVVSTPSFTDDKIKKIIFLALGIIGLIGGIIGILGIVGYFSPLVAGIGGAVYLVSLISLIITALRPARTTSDHTLDPNRLLNYDEVLFADYKKAIDFQKQFAPPHGDMSEYSSLIKIVNIHHKCPEAMEYLVNSFCDHPAILLHLLMPRSKYPCMWYAEQKIEIQPEYDVKTFAEMVRKNQPALFRLINHDVVWRPFFVFLELSLPNLSNEEEDLYIEQITKLQDNERGISTLATLLNNLAMWKENYVRSTDFQASADRVSKSICHKLEQKGLLCSVQQELQRRKESSKEFRKEFEEFKNWKDQQNRKMI